MKRAFIIKGVSRRGFTLLELMLSMVLFGSIMMGIVSLMQTYSEREHARTMNRYMMSVMTAVKTMLSEPTVFHAFYEATLDNEGTGGGYEMAVTDMLAVQAITYNNGTLKTLNVQPSRKLDANFKATSPLRSDVRVLLRIADNPANEDDERALEIFVVTSRPVDTNIAQKAANEGGMNGGYIGHITAGNFQAGYGSVANAYMFGAYRNWRQRLNNTSRLQATAWYGGLLTSISNATTQGTYLAYYDYLNRADITSDYLYRTPDPDTSTYALNTMYGPLNMGGNDIIGADDVEIGGTDLSAADADNLGSECQDKVLCVQGSVIVKGAASITGADRRVTVNGSALVADSSRVGAMEVRNAMDSDDTAGKLRDKLGAKGLFIADGDKSNNDAITVDGDGIFNQGVTATSGKMTKITTKSLAMSGGVLTAHGLAAESATVSATTINADSMSTSAGQTLNVGTLKNTDVTVVDGKAGITFIKKVGEFRYGENTDSTTKRTITVPIVQVKKLNIDEFKTCEDGCQAAP